MAVLLGFSSQHPWGSSQQSLTTAPGDPIPLLTFVDIRRAHVAQTYMQANYTCAYYR